MFAFNFNFNVVKHCHVLNPANYGNGEAFLSQDENYTKKQLIITFKAYMLIIAQ